MIEPGASEKSVDAYRTISEVAADLKLPQHVLRFWETRFSQVRPLKRAGGRRFYRPEDVDLLRAVKALLYGDGYTIKGVQRILREQGPRAVAALAAAPSRQVAAGRTGTPGRAGPANDVTLPTSSAAPRRDPEPPAVAPSTDFWVAASGHRLDADVPRDAVARLRAVLADLADCARLLASVRPGSR